MAASPSEHPDAFEFNGYRVKWTGWRELVNQDLQVGFWMANRLGEDTRYYASTTGTVGEALELYALDTSVQKGWPRSLAFSEPHEWERAKKTALWNLLSLLKTCGIKPE